MVEYIVEKLSLDGAFNANRYTFNFIKSDVKCNGIIIFPICIKNVDSSKYNNSHYRFGHFLKGNVTIRGVNYNDDSLSVALFDEVNLLTIAKLICYRFNQDTCLLKDNITNKLYLIERDDSYDICN